jgi:hypothetical protein
MIWTFIEQFSDHTIDPFENGTQVVRVHGVEMPMSLQLPDQ